jgi:hypothetical protein
MNQSEPLRCGQLADQRRQRMLAISSDHDYRIAAAAVGQVRQ